MVRTYHWNPSTQSSPSILGNCVDEDGQQPAGTSSSPILYNPYSNHCLSRSGRKYGNGQLTTATTTLMPTSLSKSDGHSGTSGARDNNFLPACSNHLQYTAAFEPWLLHHQFPQPQQPLHEAGSIFQHHPCGLTSMGLSYHTWKPYQNMMFGHSNAQIRPIDPWQLRPVQIGNKIYYEPVDNSYSDLSVAASTSSATFPRSIVFLNVSC